MNFLSGLIVFELLGHQPMVVISRVSGMDSNPCIDIDNGWISLESTCRMSYVQCYRNSVVGEFNCPEGTYFHDDLGHCDWGSFCDEVPSGSEQDANVATTSSSSTLIPKTMSTVVTSSTSSTKSPPSSSTISGNEYLSYNEDISEKCSEIGFGKLGLTEFIGFIICEGGEPTSTEHCEPGTLYDIESEVCYDYCALEKQREKISSRLGDGGHNAEQQEHYVLLPNLAGTINCFDYSKNVCIHGSHYDPEIQNCRNFCTSKGDQEFSSLPGNIGGVICSDGKVIETIWCSHSDTSFDETSGVCMPSFPTTQLPPSYTTTQLPQTSTTTQPVSIENIFLPENETLTSKAEFFQNDFDDFAQSSSMPQLNGQFEERVETYESQEMPEKEKVKRRKKVKAELTLLHSGSEENSMPLSYYILAPLIEMFVFCLFQ
eukprot:CAMPEP_0171341010 /NCGR_PEP_ID=MMETSP0878-20121228/8911_1 /TAXON_ID=67004 /ORGANISM="Thalassiosira weissflogii, Strain CCMP1336" /LENGTH=429 /DNA_ID=CAMNT_0011843137 /DNA_START=31 /DNA_END=1320 /DNA_ORIENTATION=-